MVQGVGRGGAASAAAAEATQVVNTPVTRGGAGEGGLLSTEKDQKQAASAPKFGEIYNQIQAKYGAKPEKPREIKKTLGKDDFLRIMITQMKNQDPTNPFKAEQMATEVAQFTSVEQLSNVNQNLSKMASQNKPIEQMSMTNLIGKTVTIDRQRFPHLEGQADALSFNLPRDATEVQVAVVSEGGEEVLTKDLGAQKAGEVSFTWDGIKSNTLPAKPGNYMLRVEAKNEKGQSIETNPQAQARVIGISFEGTEPVFLVGDARHQDRVTMKNIIRIEMDAPPAAAAPGQGLSAASANQPPKPRNFITFQKGVGSSNFTPGMPSSLETESVGAAASAPASAPAAPAGMNPEVAQALEKFQKAMESPPEEKGFPNGLHDLDSTKIDVKKGGN